MGTTPKVDWEKVKLEYVQGGDSVTMRGLAGAYGLHPTTVEKRAGREGWYNHRLAFRQEVSGIVAQETAQARAELQAQELIERQDGLHGLFPELLERVRSAKPGFELQAAATALKIILDTLDRQLDRGEAGHTGDDGAGTLGIRTPTVLARYIGGEIDGREFLLGVGLRVRG